MLQKDHSSIKISQQGIFILQNSDRPLMTQMKFIMEKLGGKLILNGLKVEMN